MAPVNDYLQEYIDGKVEFFYLDFFVDKNVLIPRFETETLVRRVLQDIKNNQADILIDIGTGSGIIPISIAKNSTIQTFFGLDICEKVLDIAKKNTVQHTVDIDFQVSNLLSFFLENPTVLDQKRVILTANLPYIKADDWEHMSTDTRYEPVLALFGGTQTGFELYEEFFEQIELLSSIVEMRSLIVYIEMGYDQSELAKQICQSHDWECELFADLAGIFRFAKIEIIL